MLCGFFFLFFLLLLVAPYRGGGGLGFHAVDPRETSGGSVLRHLIGRPLTLNAGATKGRRGPFPRRRLLPHQSVNNGPRFILQNCIFRRGEVASRGTDHSISPGTKLKDVP